MRPQECLQFDNSAIQSFEKVIEDNHFDNMTVFGLGLTYQEHVDETKGICSPKLIPVFIKDTDLTIATSHCVRLPSNRDLLKNLQIVNETVAKALGTTLDAPLLDYEIELGAILLDDPHWNNITDTGYSIEIGYFLANDLSARSIAILGTGKNEADLSRHWGASKGFEGFLPVGEKVLIPDDHNLDRVLCTQLTLKKNGVTLQNENSCNLLFSMRELLVQIQKAVQTRAYPEQLPRKGDIILTGTPGGVAIGTSPIWKRVFADLFKFSGIKRYNKLIVADEKNRNDGKERVFLQAGDILHVDGGILGSFEVRVIV